MRLWGATRGTGEFSLNVVEHLLAYGYSGVLYPVNPNNVDEIAGVKAYQSVGDIEASVDMEVIMTPREIVLAALTQCADKGIACTIVAAQGFGDAEDKEGHELNSPMKEVIRNTGIRVLGPNTLGTANAFINFSSSFVRVMMEKQQACDCHL
ncbi:MAG: CoA-binding protein [Dehalococcoidia bacterium]|nr:CoA-binding protein [Dehalococcoidia bacterium]